MASLFSPFRNTYRYLQHAAHTNPVIFYAIIVGAAGPVAVVTVPPIRKAYGWKPHEKIPTSYPMPNRARSEVSGYDDDEE